MSSQDWYHSLAFGNLGEELARKKIKRFLTSVITYYDYDTTEGRANQRKGIDFNVSLKEFTFDVKVRDYSYWFHKDILIEVDSVIEKKVPGWYYTSKSDLIFYTWFNRNRTDLHDAKIILLTPAREFIKKYMEETKLKYYIAETNRDGEIYHTRNFAIPISKFPPGTLLECDVTQIKSVYYLDDETPVNKEPPAYNTTQADKNTVYELPYTGNTKSTQMNFTAYGWI